MPLPPGSDDPREYGLTGTQADSIWDRYSLSPSAFRSLEEGLQERILIRIEYPNVALERAKYFSLAHFGDDGTIPDDAHSKATAQLLALRDQTAATRGLVGGLSAGPMAQPAAPLIEEMVAGIAPDNTGWKSLGPGNIGGRIRSILVDPVDTQRIYVGSVGGGVWITTDGGQSWQAADDLMANLAVCCMAMDPTDHNTVYAGTGEGYFDWGDQIRGNGIYATSDGWVWRSLGNTAANADFQWVNSLTINSDASVMLAGTRTGIFRSTDRGVTWSKQRAGLVGNLLFNPADKTKAIAGMMQGGGILYSTDGGLTWTRSTVPAVAGLGRIEVCYAANDASRVYASVEVNNGSQIWSSDDGGKTFASKSTANNYLNSQGWYANAIWAGDPTNKNFVIVGGLDLWKSSDGGATLTQISQWWSEPASAHADHHFILADPGFDGAANKIAYFGNDGGIYKAANVSTVGSPTLSSGWVFLGTRLPITQFYGAAGNATTMTVVGGAQDNGTLRYTTAAGANAWSKVYGGDGGYCASDRNNSNNYYGEYVYLQIFRNTNAADPNQSDYICGRFGNGWKPAPFTIADAQNQAALFIAPFALDPNNSNCLLAGGASLWRTTNVLAANGPAAGPAWTAIKGQVGAAISAVAVAPGNSDLVLVGYDNGRIDLSVNATAAAPAWARIDTNGIGANRLCTWLAIDANDNNRFYATFGGFQADNVWTSANRGALWTSIGAPLPQAPVRCVTIHPQNSAWIYVGTEVGIFASEDRGQTWSPTNQGATNCVIYQLFWLGNTLYCVSHGRGMFSIDLTIHQQATLVVTAELRGSLTARSPQDGSAVSTNLIPGSQISAAPAIDGNIVYCGYQQPFSICKYADANNLAAGPAWTAAVGGSVNATPALVKATYPGDPDLLYSVAADGKLYVINAATGALVGAALQIVPAAQVGTGVNVFANLVMNQWVYVATDQGFYAVNTLTSGVAWSSPVICLVPPLIAANTVFVPTQDGKVHAFAARTGVENWNYAGGGVISSTPVWILGSVIVGSQAGKLVGLDYATGAEQFSASFPGETINAIVADGDELYFAGNALNGHLYSYRVGINGAARSLTQLWSVPMRLGAANLPPVVGNTLYVTSGDRKLSAYDIITGACSWSVQLTSIAMAAPALVY